MKKSIAFILALVLALSFSVTAFAEAPEHTTYAIEIDAPDKMLMGEVCTTASATLYAAVEGENGYSNVLFRITVDAPTGANPRIMAVDTANNPYNLAEIGYWGPASGFPVSKDYSATTSFTELSFDKPGYYTAHNSLVDVTTEDVLASAEKSILVVPFEMQDFNLWGEAWPGAYNVGWKYADSFDTDSITGLEVGMVDENDTLIVRYTASGEQLAYQRENGYILAQQSSAPFYKEYNGAALVEGYDDDWTVEKGPAFDKWDAYRCYVVVETNDGFIGQYNTCTHVHSYTEEIVSPTALKSPATLFSPAVYYKTCPDCGAISSKEAYTFVDGDAPFEMQDFNLWGEAWPGAYNVGWKYADTFDPATITGLEVGMMDANENLIVRYTASGEQLAYQRENGYILAQQSSAPFYKEYKGAALVEGYDDDWTVEKGPAFDKWDAYYCYVEVTTKDGSLRLADVCDHMHAYTEEVVCDTALKSPATFSSPAVYYKSCPECGAISSRDTDTFTYGSALPVSGMISGITNGMGSMVMSPFVDVRPMDYYFDAVKWAVENGITTGTGRLSFSPDEPCTRAQAVTFLYRAAGCPKSATTATQFTDVDANAYYAKAVAWAVENGITNGTSATTFSPDAPCTRAQIVTFLYRAFGSKANASAPFTDVAADAYYAPAVSWAASNHVTGGTGDGKFSPEAVCTRAQIVTFLYRCCG